MKTHFLIAVFQVNLDSVQPIFSKENQDLLHVNECFAVESD